MSTTTEYTQTDIEKAATLMARMMPLMMQGMTFEQAGEAVLERNYELLKAAKSKTGEGAMIRRELATVVYNEIRR